MSHGLLDMLWLHFFCVCLCNAALFWCCKVLTLLVSKCIYRQVEEKCREVCNSSGNVKIPIMTSSSFSNENKCASFRKLETWFVSAGPLLFFTFCNELELK